jgi:hypothetical protein
MNRLVTILCALLAIPVMAADFYVSQNGSGSTNSLAWLNVQTNWNRGAGTILPGDTVHLCGTLTNNLGIRTNGTAGNPITILFEPNAKFSAGTMFNTGWIQIADHIVIDGGANGRLELTDNGTTSTYGGTFSTNNGSVWGIFGDNHNDVTINNLTIAGLYVRQTVTDPGPVNCSGNEPRAIFMSDPSSLTVSNCVISDCQSPIWLTYNSGHHQMWFSPIAYLRITTGAFQWRRIRGTHS